MKRCSILKLALQALLIGGAISGIAHAQQTVYLNPAWSGTAEGADPDGSGPATKFSAVAWSTTTDADSFAAIGNVTSWLAESSPLGITQFADSPSSTITSNAHGYQNGDTVLVTHTNTSLDGQVFTVSGVTANTFQINLGSAVGAAWSAARGYVHRTSIATNAPNTPVVGVSAGAIVPGRLILSAGSYELGGNTTVNNKLIIGPNNGISPTEHTRRPEANFNRVRFALFGTSGLLGCSFDDVNSTGSGSSGMIFRGSGDGVVLAFNRFDTPTGQDAFAMPIQLADSPNGTATNGGVLVWRGRFIAHNRLTNINLPLANTLDTNSTALRSWRAEGQKISFNYLEDIRRRANYREIASLTGTGSQMTVNISTVATSAQSTGFAVGQLVQLTGTGVFALDGSIYPVAAVTGTAVTLTGDDTGGATINAGTITRVYRATNIVDSGASLTTVTVNGHGYANNNEVQFGGTGIPELDGNTFVISGVTANTFTVPVEISGQSSTQGLAPRVFAGIQGMATDVFLPHNAAPLVFRNTISNVDGNGIQWGAGGGPAATGVLSGGGVIGNTIRNAGGNSSPLTAAVDSDRAAIVLGNITTRTITATTDADPVVVTTSAAHGFAVGQSIGVSGTGVSGVDGIRVITAVPSTTTFEFDVPSAPGATAAAGSAATLDVTTTTRIVANTITNLAAGRHGIRFAQSSDNILHNFYAINNNAITGPFTALGLSRGNADRTGQTVNAQSNYWGSASGPSGLGAGSGSAVDTLADFSGFLTAPPATTDTDGDRLTNIEEAALGTNPNAADSDGDGLNDYIELWAGLDPVVSTTYTDADSDGLPSTVDPDDNDSDFDGDGRLDGAEVAGGFDINGDDASPPSLDINTGLTTALERNYAIRPTQLSSSDSQQPAGQIVYTVTSGPSLGTLSATTFTQADINNLLVTYRNETPGASDSFTFTVSDGTSASVPPISGTFNITILNSLDTDRDGVPDSIETSVYGINPNSRDSDGDGVEDGVEIAIGTDPNDGGTPIAANRTDTDRDLIPDFYDPQPNNPDTDGDRYLDGYEYAIALTTSLFGTPGLGEANGVAPVTNQDAIALLELFLGVGTAVVPQEQLDVTRNGTVNNVDAVLLYQWVLGNVEYLPFQ